MAIIRSAAIAGTFYPEQPDILLKNLLDLLVPAMKPNYPTIFPKAIIAPHAGYVFSGTTAAAIYARFVPKRQIIRKIVLIGPAHYVGFQGIGLSSADFYQTPLGSVPLDREAAHLLLTTVPGIVIQDQAQAPEHCLEVHVPFLQSLFEQFTLLPLLIGQANPDLVKYCLEKIWGGPETLIIISSDLSHYLEDSKARQIDQETRQAIEDYDDSVLTSGHACGFIAIQALLKLARERSYSVETIALCNSSDSTGPKESVVGYGAWAFYEPQTSLENIPNLDRALQRQLPLIARQGLEFYLSGKGTPYLALGAPLALFQPAACFVTLKHHGQLRGCIGSSVAYRPLAQDLLDNAILAATKDTRFQPVTLSELSSLELSVSLLTPYKPMLIQSEDDLLDQLRPHIDGLIIEDGTSSALFLPSVWSILPDKKLFLNHLKQKAGLSPDHWSENFKAFCFEAIEIEEEKNTALIQH